MLLKPRLSTVITYINLKTYLISDAETLTEFQ